MTVVWFVLLISYRVVYDIFNFLFEIEGGGIFHVIQNKTRVELFNNVLCVCFFFFFFFFLEKDKKKRERKKQQKKGENNNDGIYFESLLVLAERNGRLVTDASEKNDVLSLREL